MELTRQIEKIRRRKKRDKVPDSSFIMTFHAETRMKRHGIRMHHISEALKYGELKFGRAVHRYRYGNVTLVMRDGRVLTCMRQTDKKWRETYRGD